MAIMYEDIINFIEKKSSFKHTGGKDLIFTLKKEPSLSLKEGALISIAVKKEFDLIEYDLKFKNETTYLYIHQIDDPDE